MLVESNVNIQYDNYVKLMAELEELKTKGLNCGCGQTQRPYEQFCGKCLCNVLI